MSSATRYQLTRTLASGGMAQVYEAVAIGDRGFERRVAIKRILPEHANDESMQRMFFDEAKIASHLHHGNIVQVLDYGIVDETEFIAMEFVDGLDARRACKEAGKSGEPLSEALAFHVVAEVAYALDYAHGRASETGDPLGIVHRDVSPQNILLSWDGDVKLTDFGIAASFEKEEKTATGVVKGKLPYMPPEQAMGQRVDASADVYALGASLHAMLTSAPPMVDPEAMARRLVGEAVVVSDRISEDAADLVRRCMSPDPGERPSAESVAFRAGQLANKRLQRDARGALREWISPFKKASSRRGGLDELMGLCLVATAVEDRQFTVSRDFGAVGRPSGVPTKEVRPKPKVVAEEPAPSVESTAVPTAAPSAAPTADDPPKRAGRRYLIASAALVTLGGLAAWGVTISTGGAPGGETVTLPTAEGQPGDAGVAAMEEPTPPDRATEEPEQDAVDQAADPAVPAESVEPEPDVEAEPEVPDRERLGRSGVAMRRRPAMSMESPAMTHEVPVPTEEPVPRGRAWLRVGHPRGAGQERVFVDGVAVGYTPNLFQVTVGSHAVEVRSVSSGETLVRQSVRVRADHTRAAPSVMPR